MGKFEPKSKNILGDAIDFYTEDNEIGSVEEIDIDLLKPFHDHPFKLYEGERLNDMVESIKTYGIMTPVIVRKMKKDYEILAGHNRTNAARLAGLSKVPCIVKDKLTDEEAYVYVIETNLMQRSFGDLATSEKAVVLKERYDNIKSQGKRNDIIRELKKLNGEEIEEPADDSSNRDDIAGEYGLSGATMARLLRVNYLTCDMKTAVDNGKLPLLSAVNLSYIDDNAQCDVYSVMKESGVNQSDDWLEQKHDYIQWLFPTDQLSHFNLKAPVISTKSADDLVQKHGDKLKEKILESFFRMAKFYGFHVFYNIDGSITIKPNDVIGKGWLNKGNHNFLRLTRIMQ